MEKGRYKEVEAQNPVAEEVQVVVEMHYSRDPATQDTQVGHTRGSVVVAVDVEAVDMGDRKFANDKAVQAAEEDHKVADFEYNQASWAAAGYQPLRAAERGGKQESGVEQRWAYSQGLLAVGDWILAPDGTEEQKDNYSHLNLYCPGN